MNLHYIVSHYTTFPPPNYITLSCITSVPTGWLCTPLSYHKKK